MVSVIVLGVLGASSLAHATDTWTTPHPGMRHLHRVTATQNINALEIDLCAAGVSVRATKESERGRTVASFGALVGAHAAINGNYFNLTTYETTGPAMGEGVAWGGSDASSVAPVQFGPFRVALAADGSTTGLATWARQVVSGRPSLLVGGTARDANAASTCDVVNPRTGLGLSANKEKLFLVVVDGRATDRVGMTCNQLGALLAGLGAADAINLDGGGSSTMWLAGTGVVNFPSDGVQRAVGNHLAIHATGTGLAPNCPRPRYVASAVASEQTLALTAGEAQAVTLDLVNEGNVSWDGTTLLGTQDPADRASALYDPTTWVAPDRAAAADPTVAAGATGHFTFTLLAPPVTEPTTFVERFQLVHADAWFGPVQTITVTVSPAPTTPPDATPAGHAGCATTDRPGNALLLLVALTLARRRRATSRGLLKSWWR